MPEKNPKNKNIDSYLDNENVKWFLYNILQKESDKTPEGNVNYGGYNQSAGNSTAFGAGQFIGSTRNEILDEYGVDAWSSDFSEQQKAILSLLDKDGDLDAIAKGNYNSQKRGRWEAFSKDKKALGNQRPEGWGNDYQNLLNNAVYEPDASWGKLSKEMQDEKTKWYTEKYNGLFPSNILTPKYSEEFGSYLYDKPVIVEDVDFSKTKHIVDLEQNPNDPLNPSYLNEMQNFLAAGGVNTNKMNKRYYATGGIDPSLPLNVRNNNPGNLRPITMKNANNWWGEGAVTSIDSDNGFAIFSSPEEGLKALKQQLTLDGIKRGMTIKELIYKFAPPDDNNPSDAYAANMANALGLKVDDKISKNQIDDFAAAVIRQEGGPSALDSYKDFLPESSVNNARLSFDVDKTGDNIAAALGLPTSEDLQSQLQSYNDIKAYEELAASDPDIEMTLPNQNYDPNKSISEQYLKFNPELTEYFQGAGNIPSVPINTQPSSTESSEDLQTKVQAYNDLKSYDDAVAAGQADFALANPNYDPDRPQAEQYLNANPDIRSAIEGTADPSTPSSGGDPLNPPQSLIDKYGDDAYVFWKNMTPEMRTRYKSTSDAGDPASTATGATGKSSGYEGMSAEELQGMYQSLLDADAAAAAGDGVYPLINQDFEPGPQAPQFLERRMAGEEDISDSGIPESDFVDPRFDPSPPDFLSSLDIPEDDIPEEIEPDVADGDYSTEDPVKRNMLSKLKGQDYMGMLSDIGGYAARMAPLGIALRDAGSYDEERYPRFSPVLPTAYVPKNDVKTAFTTAQDTALQQGKLDLGALSALATQQARETARVEENVANERVGLINQAQNVNNQITMQEMADTSANKGAAATMKYQALAAMSQMGQGSLREANMRRNDANVKAMFENVFGDEFGSYLKDKYNNA